ncbi:acetyl-CoA carboxylase biotin carboxyl carrier protein subunit [Flavobacteriales bacterium 34_180_T64]|nr:acetyl-CoA carboxylase biotin carboxyl carrier protein subunit [Flavobacteriales bacterium 34_180_T64]
MSNSFKVSVNNSHHFEIDNESISNLDVLQTSDSKYHVIQNNKTYSSEITDADFNSKTYKVKVNNNTYNINIHNDLDDLIKRMGFEIGSTKKVNDIKAPMPGLLLDVMVKIGQEVKEDEGLLILEAMKMENVLTAPRDGIIKSISVNKGDAVDKNQLLLEFE